MFLLDNAVDKYNCNFMDDNRKADLHLRAGLGRIDIVFMKSRRLFKILERPIGASGGQNRICHTRIPYNSAMVGAYLGALRAAHNFIQVGEERLMPAMRLGFADEPLRYKGFLWPGEWVPRLRVKRRRGRSQGAEA